MTADTLCGYPGRDEALVSYLYDDLDAAQRSAFDTHLVLCARCRMELEQLSGVRRQLSAWEPVTVTSHQSSVISPQSSVVGRQTWWREIPAWAQVAAALLCLGVGAGVANLNVRYDREGLSIRTGWLTSATQTTAGASASDAQGPKPGVPQNAKSDAAPAAKPGGAQDFSPAESAPWRADLVALERQLRTEFQSTSQTTPAGVTLTRSTQPSLSDAELLKRVRALVDESERRQKRELALRVGEMVRDVHSQRQADLRKIDQSLEYVLNNTGLAVAKQQQTLNYLVSRTAQK